MKLTAFLSCLAALWLVSPSSEACACSGDELRPYMPDGSARTEVPSRLTVTSTVSHTLDDPCSGLSGVSFMVHAGAGEDTSHLGLRIRLLDGDPPFVLPDAAVELIDGRATETWWNSASPARRAWRARFAAALVGPDGDQSRWYEFEVVDPGFLAFLAWLGSYFWPAAVLLNVLIVYAARRIVRWRTQGQ